MMTSDAKKAVIHACEVHGVSQRRACQTLRIDRSAVRYTRISPDDAPLREAMKAMAAERQRFSYRRIHIMLNRQGIVMKQKKLRRLYRQEKLQVRQHGGRERALVRAGPYSFRIAPMPAGAGISSPIPSPRPSLPGAGRRRRLQVQVPGLIADTSLPGLRVVRELDAIISWRGRPDTIVSDNGIELSSMAVLRVE